MNRFKRMSGTTLAVLDIVKILLVLAGGFILIADGSKAYEAYNSQFWPTTTGEIIVSSLDTYADSLGKRTYRSRIKYTYTIDQPANDDDYLISDRISIYLPPRSDNRAIAEAGLDDYPRGSSVEVYYNPNRPEKSILEPRFSLTYLIMPVLGLLCLGVALGLWRVNISSS